MADREFPATGPDPYFVFPDPVPEPIRHPHNPYVILSEAEESTRAPTTTLAPVTSNTMSPRTFFTSP